MGPFDYFKEVFKKYTVFTGRARRAEYWWFTLFSMLLSYGLTLLGFFVLDIPWLGNIYSFAVLLPSLAVAVRRLHDVGKSGWFILIPIYNLVLLVTPGMVGPNEYGPDPKGATNAFFTSEPEVY
ncbi:MAG: DUF805 domain-containing protein [Janthinobacterium lividum]